ncbi:MAG: response regulator [Gammaproteobacteria bacterium]|nr:response regulator [Gammaproteobacteria bacterium]
MAKKILVVDDTAAHLEKIREIIAGAGYQVATASSGHEGVAKAKSEKPDLVLLDIVMDDLDGYGACREITSDEETKNIPVIFVSTKNQRADRLWAEKQGAKALIAKPIDGEEILKHVQRYV